MSKTLKKGKAASVRGFWPLFSLYYLSYYRGPSSALFLFGSLDSCILFCFLWDGKSLEGEEADWGEVWWDVFMSVLVLIFMEEMNF